jgi:hypothetical protein
MIDMQLIRTFAEEGFLPSTSLLREAGASRSRKFCSVSLRRDWLQGNARGC